MSSEPAPALMSQYEALAAGAGVVDFADRSQIEVSGADRAKFLHNFCTNDVLKLLPGQGCEAFFTNVQGKILGHFLIFCGADSLVLESVAGQAEAIIAHLDRYLISEDATLADRSVEWTELLVSGSDSPDLLQQVFGVSIPSGLCDHLSIEAGEDTISIRRVEITGPNCFLLSCPHSAAATIVRQLTDTGAARCDREAVEMARIEAGWPYFGPDISEKNLPQEVARDAQAISFTKGCYLGQETVARIDALGHVNRQLVGVKLMGETVPARGDELRSGDKVVGTVTSAAFSPRLQMPLALAYVRSSHVNAGTRLDASTGAAEVIALPVA